MTGVSAQIAAMRKSVLGALDAAGVTGVDIFTRAVDYRPLEWYAPGIYPHTDINGTSPSLFMGLDTLVYYHEDYTPQQLYDETLRQLAIDPEAVVAPDQGYLLLPSQAFNLTAEARVVFSNPVVSDSGGPTDEAAYTFAMEFAAAAASANLGKTYRNDNDFYTIGPGLLVGIRDGRILNAPDWQNVDISGYINAFLSMPRGRPWTTHTLDGLDRLAFWNADQIEPLEGLEGLTEVLPIFRCYLLGSDVDRFADQLWQLGTKPHRLRKKKKRATPADYFRRIDDASALMADWRVTDQQRIMGLLDLLVPYVLPEYSFNKRIYDTSRPVRTLVPNMIKRINKTLEDLKNKPRIPDVD